MKIKLFASALALLLAATSAFGATHTATNCEETGANSIGSLAAAILADTDATITVVWPLNTTGCHWTAPVTYTIPATATTFTLTGAGTSATGGGDQTVIIDDYVNVNPLFVVDTSAVGSTVTISGFTIQGGSAGSSEKSDGLMYVDGYSKNFRLHHVHFNAQTYSPVLPASTLKFSNHINGVVDHSIFDLHSVGNGIKVQFSAYGGVADNGSGSFAAATNFGSSDFLFVEDNIFNGNSRFSTINDCIIGGKMVIRFNTLNVASTQTHPSRSGYGRGCRAMEMYFNFFNYTEADMATIGSGNAITYAFLQDSGTSLMFGNNAPHGYVNLQTGHAPRRSNDGGNHLENPPPAGWGYCGPVQQTGTVNTNGTTTVTKASGTDFNTSWGAGSMIHIGGTGDTQGFQIVSVSSTSTLTVSSAVPAQTGATYYMGSAWDGNTNIFGYPCLDQPGRGRSDLLTGTFPNVINATTACTPSATVNCWPNQLLEPVYNWLNTWTPVPGFGNSILFDPADVVVENRDYYLYAGSLQTSAASPFNGTVGVGAGIIARRPSTCTAGVAYWATDEGSWRTATPSQGVIYTGQGQLYKCTATNTWTLFYTPYDYPFTPAASSGATQTDFTDQPATSITSGGSLGTVVVTIKDSGGSTVTSATNTVAVALCSGTGTLGGTVSTAAVAGLATFSDLTLTAASGSFTLCATSSGLTGDTSDSITITGSGAAPTAAGVMILP